MYFTPGWYREIKRSDIVMNRWCIGVCLKRGRSTLDKQRICVNTQLKSSKKQLKWNVCVPKSNYNDQYAITCDVIAYHSVHFLSIWVINKCQSGIDFFYQRALNINPVLWKYRCPVQNFSEKHCDESETFAKCTRSNVNKGMRFASGTIKSACLIL